jgi:hypothetical protein
VTGRQEWVRLEDLAATGDVAADLGVKNAAVSNYPRRYPDFPAPLKVLSTGPVYSREQVRQWARARWPGWEFPWMA